MTQPCPGRPDQRIRPPQPWAEMSLALGRLVHRTGTGAALNPPAHDGGYCCWACDHGWDDAGCTCREPAEG